jgi:hypothetical protein
MVGLARGRERHRRRCQRARANWRTTGELWRNTTTFDGHDDAIPVDN